MVGKKGEYPYDKYYVYVVFHKKEKRNYAILCPIDKTSGLKRTSVSYARYLMSVKLGRFLLPTEQVDHIDDDKQNDDVSNLQILTNIENVSKECKHRKQSIGTLMVRLKCPVCGREFIRRKGLTHLTKNRGNVTTCSRNCRSKFVSMISRNLIDDDSLKKLYDQNVVEVFRDKNVN